MQGVSWRVGAPAHTPGEAVHGAAVLCTGQAPDRCFKAPQPAGRPGAVCVGWPGPGVQVRVQPLEVADGQGSVIAASGRAAASARVQQPEQAEVLGEVCVHGACVMGGYWGAPLETEQVSCGWCGAVCGVVWCVVWHGVVKCGGVWC